MFLAMTAAEWKGICFFATPFVVIILLIILINVIKATVLGVMNFFWPFRRKRLLKSLQSNRRTDAGDAGGWFTATFTFQFFQDRDGHGCPYIRVTLLKEGLPSQNLDLSEPS
jgi:hypothetical protein